jgi:FemAB-related protein (PEP-CTERM system-associated)
MIEVTRFTGTPTEWDEFARQQAGFTHFHLHGWKRVMEQALGHEAIYLAARGEARVLEGILPLVRVRSLIFGHYLVSMPFVNYGGPLGRDAAIAALASGSVKLAERGGVKLLELRSRRALPLDLRVSHRKVTVLLRLPDTTEELMSRFPAKLRSQVRRPAKDGVTYRFGADQVEPFFEVFSRHMHELGTPTQGRKLFETIAEVFGDSAWFGCAYLGDRAIAAGAGFEWGNEVEMTWASSLAEFNRTSANMGLYGAFMGRAIERGLTTFNFGRCTPGTGTHRFKLQWGGAEEPLWWYQRAARAGEAATPSPEQGAWSWGPRIWRKLPVPLATALGPRIVRFIP